jgi:hypothetical protein
LSASEHLRRPRRARLETLNHDTASKYSRGNDASTTIFPDGHAVHARSDAAWPVFVDARSTAMLNTWVRDVSFVLDRLEELNAEDPKQILTARLDLTRVVAR